MVSSKNNAYLSIEFDPIRFIAKSSSDQASKKINMDEFISADARLSNAAECLLFEL